MFLGIFTCFETVKNGVHAINFEKVTAISLAFSHRIFQKFRLIFRKITTKSIFYSNIHKTSMNTIFQDVCMTLICNFISMITKDRTYTFLPAPRLRRRRC